MEKVVCATKTQGGVKVTFNRIIGDKITRDFEATIAEPSGPDWNNQVFLSAIETWRDESEVLIRSYEAGSKVVQFDADKDPQRVFRMAGIVVIVIGLMILGGCLRPVVEGGEESSTDRHYAEITYNYPIETLKAWGTSPAGGVLELRCEALGWFASTGNTDAVTKAVCIAHDHRGKQTPDSAKAWAYLFSLDFEVAVAAARENAHVFGYTPDEMEKRIKDLINE